MRDISMHMMDIIQNSITASATKIEILITANSKKDLLEIRISDNGCGMNKDFVNKVTDPFVTTRTIRKVGLGIPMFRESAIAAGGYFRINSEISEGTDILAGFKISNIDRIPLGDVAETLSEVIISRPDISYKLDLKSDKDVFEFDTEKIREVLQGVSISEIDVIGWIKENIEEGLKSTLGGVLNEIA
ncbi:MAG: ATP-binding protein [Clostridia bacterium]|jgi:hypothetical protein